MKPPAICQNPACGKTFQPPNRKRITKYCGNPCRYEARRRAEPPEKHKGWRYEAWRKAVLLRDGHTCQKCGSVEHIRTHHIQSWREFPALRYEVSNGQAICQTCHHNLHGAHQPRVRKRCKPVCVQCGKATKGRAERCPRCAALAYYTAHPSIPRAQDGRFTR